LQGGLFFTKMSIIVIYGGNQFKDGGGLDGFSAVEWRQRLTGGLQ